MSTIADKLQELINSKADMKSAIAEKGVEVEGGLTTYAAAIRKIQQGSGGGTDVDWSGARFGGSTKIPLAPNELYKCGNMDHMFESTDTWYLGANGFELSLVDTSFATSFGSIFKNSNLNGHDSMSNWDTSNVTTLERAFEDTQFINIDAISNWNTSNVINMNYCFSTNSPSPEFITIPNWDYSKVKQMDHFVNRQLFLESIPRINLGSLEGGWMLNSESIGYIKENNSIVSTIHKFEKLTDIGGFINLKIDIPWWFVSHCPNLTVESLTNIIRDLYDWEVNPDNLSKDEYSFNGVIRLAFGEVNLNKLTADQIAIATNKGWTLI